MMRTREKRFGFDRSQERDSGLAIWLQGILYGRFLICNAKRSTSIGKSKPIFSILIPPFNDRDRRARQPRCFPDSIMLSVADRAVDPGASFYEAHYRSR